MSELSGFDEMNRTSAPEKERDCLQNVALVAENRRLSEMLNALPDLFFEVDREGRVWNFFPRAAENFYAPPEVFLGKRVVDLLPEPSSTIVSNAMADAWMTGRHFGAVYPLEMKDDLRWYELSISRKGSENPVTDRLIVLARDITERKRAEELLFESESRLQGQNRILAEVLRKAEAAEEKVRALSSRYGAILASVPDIIMEVDNRKVYTWANEAGLAFFGPDVIGREASSYFVGGQDTYDQVASLFTGNEEVIYLESLQRRQDGEKRLLSWWCKTLKDETGTVTGALSSARDITEHRRLLDQLEQARKMEMVGRLAGGVAHDLNNLLVPILGYAEMLVDNFSPEDDRRKFVGEILHAGSRAKELVRGLLAFGRKQTLLFKPLDINQAVMGFETLLRRTIREDIAIKLVLAPDIPTIKADPGKLEQIFMNLSINAQDAMPRGGRLSFKTEGVTVGEADAASRPDIKPGKYVLLSVGDTGLGMDEDVKRHLFEPFFSTKGGKGNGLGLSTVYGIVKQHGGHIEVHSEPGQGALFRIFLPVSGEEVQERKPSSPRDVRDLTGRETILLVEDNGQVRHLAETILKSKGYRLLSAENGEAALKILSGTNDRIDLLLTDVVMPGINGKELSEKVTARYPGIKTLYMSGYTDNVIARFGVLSDGAFLKKPFALEALASKVRETLDAVTRVHPIEI